MHEATSSLGELLVAGGWLVVATSGCGSMTKLPVSGAISSLGEETSTQVSIILSTLLQSDA